MNSWTGQRTSTRTGISVHTAPARLCFLVEERYENDVMPGAVADVLRSWGHQVGVLRSNGTVKRSPSSGRVPEAASRLARTVLRVTRRNATSAARASFDSSLAPVLEATA